MWICTSNNVSFQNKSSKTSKWFWGFSVFGFIYSLLTSTTSLKPSPLIMHNRQVHSRCRSWLSRQKAEKHICLTQHWASTCHTIIWAWAIDVLRPLLVIPHSVTENSPYKYHNKTTLLQTTEFYYARVC